jgi:phage shock protein A
MRVFHSFKHTITTFLDQIENQEAVVLASIRELEQGATRVRVHRKRCERRIEQLEQRIAALDLDASHWRERAVRVRDDRERALECVRRHRAAERARTAHAAELEQQRALREKIVRDEDAVDTKLTELRARCASLSSREVRAAAASALGTSDIDAVFDRWEAKLDGIEPSDDAGTSHDGFARTFSKEEDDAATLAELERILGEQVKS